MRVSEIGEFGLIDLLAKRVAKAGLDRSDRLIIGIGDDASVWRAEASLQLCTTDTLVQDVDFVLGQIAWDELGWKLLAANLSDVAAMGGSPDYAVVTLGLPPETCVEDVLHLYDGLTDLAKLFNVCIAGGDITRAPQVILSVTLLGTATSGKLLTRSAARPGDLVAVTGFLGSSGAGLKMLSSNLKLDARTSAFLRQAHFRPRPRIEEGRSLLRHGVKCAIDISDGLVSDLAHVCQASGVEARVQTDRLPVHRLVRAAFKRGYLGLALGSGEDFELLFTAPPRVMRRLEGSLRVPATVIGEIVPGHAGKVSLLDKNGNTIRWRNKGWDHFAARRTS